MHSAQPSFALAIAGVTLSGAVALGQSFPAGEATAAAMSGVMSNPEVIDNPYTLETMDGTITSFGGSSPNGWGAQMWEMDSTITVGDKLFSNITVDIANGLSVSDVENNLAYAGINFGGDFGLIFGLGGFFTNTAGGNLNFQLSYDVTVLGTGFTAVGASSFLTGAGSTNAGNAQIGEQIFDFTIPGNIGSLFVEIQDNPPIVNGLDTTSFTQPSTTFTVTKNVQVTSPNVGDSAEISSFVQTFAQVPEPSTYAAIFGGLALVLAVVRRRFRRS